MAFNVRLLRTTQGLSQEQLAIDSKVAAPYVSRIERGLVNPTIGVLDRLAATLKVEIDALLRQPPEGTPLPEPLRAGRKPPPEKAFPPSD